METVETMSQIVKNIITLNNYKNTKHDEFFKKLICRGVVFASVRIGDEILFAPSRFVGYIDNNTHHYEHYIHGGDTNRKIDKTLNQKNRKNLFFKEINPLFEEYCKSLGIKPNKKKHRFWSTIIID